MHVRILGIAVFFQASQVLDSSGIVMGVNALYFTTEAKHKIDLPVGHAQQIKIGFGPGVTSLMEVIELSGILFKFRDFDFAIINQIREPDLRLSY